MTSSYFKNCGKSVKTYYSALHPILDTVASEQANSIMEGQWIMNGPFPCDEGDAKEEKTL